MSDPALAGDFATLASIRPALAVLVPAIAAAFAVATTNPRRRGILATVAAAVTFLLVVGSVPDVLAGRVHVTDVGQLAPGIPFSLRFDALGLLFAALVSGLFLVAIPFSNEYRSRHSSLDRSVGGSRYTASLLASLAAAMGIAVASNLLVLFVFFELLTLASYALLSPGDSWDDRRARYAYLAYSFTGGLLVLGGLRVVYSLSGSVTFVPGGIPELVAATPESALSGIGFGLLFVGFGVRAALVPLYGWLRGARRSPGPVYALVFVTVVLKAGAFGIARTVLETFGPVTVAALGVTEPALVIVAATILVTIAMAVRQADLLARFTSLAIAGNSIVIAGLVVGTPVAIDGALLFFVAHAVATLTAFLALGVLGIDASVRSVQDLQGVADRLPFTTGAFAVACGSLAGVPLLAGFVGLWSLLVGFASATVHLAIAVVIASCVGHLVAVWPLLATAYVDAPPDLDPAVVLQRETPAIRFLLDGGAGPRATLTETLTETSGGFLVPLLVATAFLVGFGIVPDQLVVPDLVGVVVEAATGRDLS